MKFSIQILSRSGIRCTPLLVTVRRRTDIIAEVTDDGFQPDIIYIDQGHSIKWQWKQCSSPHSVQEVKYEISRACFKKDPDNAGYAIFSDTRKIH